MSSIHWDSVIEQLDDQYLQEALEDFCLPCSVPSSHGKKEIMQMKNHTHHTFVRIGTLAAATALIFTLGMTAYATGIFDSIIAKMSGAYATPDENRDAQYEAAAEQSHKTPESIDLKQLLGNAITLEESYYDGSELMLVYALDAMTYPVNFSFGAEDARYANLEKLDSVGMEWFQSEFQVSGKDYDEISRKIRETGEASFILPQISLGDHVLLEDGTDIGPMTVMNFDGSVFLEPQNGLPEEAKNRDELDVVFTINCRDICFRMDGENIYAYWSEPQSEDVTFTIPKTAR